jgi:hypothetical protein
MDDVAEVTTQMLPTQLRAAQVQPSTFNAERRTVDVVFTTGAVVRRYDWMRDRYFDEELVVSEDAVDLSRMRSGASVLNTHGQWDLDDVIGVVTDAAIVGREGHATVQLSERPELAGIVSDIQAGIIRHISAGYTINRVEMIPPESRTDGSTVWLYRATRWTPAEISFVPVPADAGAGTRSQPSQPAGTPCEFITRAAARNPQPESSTMDETQAGGNTPTPAIAETRLAPAAPAVAQPQPGADVAARAAEITELCVRHNVPALAADLIRNSADVSAARAAVLDHLARADAQAGGHRNAAPRIETVRDQAETRLAGIRAAIANRLDPRTQIDDNARQFRGMTLMEIGRDMLEAGGVSTRGMDRVTLAQRAMSFRAGGMHTTSDFASIFANVANNRLRGAYEQNPGTYRVWARRAPNAPDTKNIQVSQLSGAPDLLPVNEHGEYTYGTLRDGAATYKVAKYGRIVSLSEEAFINDDLRAFDRLLTAFGDSAARLENGLVYAQITGNPVMADTFNLFDAANHGNNGTGAPSALSFDSMKTGRAAMRVQKGLGGEPLNLAPAYLIVPAALEQTAYQLTSSNYVPATKAEVNEFRAGGRTSVEPVVEPLLDAASATAWYFAANSGQVDTVEYCYLDGYEGPTVRQKEGWEVDGMEFKCVEWFAAKVIDHRGLYKANGA